MFRKISSATNVKAGLSKTFDSSASTASLRANNWKVDEELTKREVPAALTQEQRRGFITLVGAEIPNEEWVDFDKLACALAMFLEILPYPTTSSSCVMHKLSSPASPPPTPIASRNRLPSNASPGPVPPPSPATFADLFNTYKWVFWTENPLNTKLMVLLASLRFASRSEPNYQFRAVEDSLPILGGSNQAKRAVVALDFGTTHSGFAFALTSPPQTVRFGKFGGKYDKQPTAALFDGQLNLKEYGVAAREWFMRNQAQEHFLDGFGNHAETELLYFDGDLKMRLWNNEAVNPEARTCRTLGGKGTAPLLDVVGKILERMKNDALAQVNEYLLEQILGAGSSPAPPPQQQQQQMMMPEPITCIEVLWVITVPAIWREQDKQFMRRAACMAKMVDEPASSDLILALEPECAALATKVNASMVRLDPGDKFMIFDCGGGTVDVCAIEVLPESKPDRFLCKQLLAPTGGPWGGKRIDDAFFAFFEKFMGQTILARLSTVNPAALIDVMEKWEKLKMSLTLSDFQDSSGSARKTLDLSFVLLEAQEKLSVLCKRYNATQPDASLHLHSKSESLLGEHILLVIPCKVLVHFFHPTLDAIVDHARYLFRTFPDELASMKQLLLCGGLGVCPLLMFKFERAFPQCTVFHSGRSTALVEYGAVRFGLQPSVFQSRKSRLTLGVKATVEYQPGIHVGAAFRENKFYDRVHKKHYVRNMFKPFLCVGDNVSADSTFVHRFAVPGLDAEYVKFDIYTCDDHPPVTFITEEPCRLLARILVPVTRGAGEVLEMCVHVGFTEIRAEIRRADTKVVLMQRVLFEYRGGMGVPSTAEALSDNENEGGEE